MSHHALFEITHLLTNPAGSSLALIQLGKIENVINSDQITFPLSVRDVPDAGSDVLFWHLLCCQSMIIFIQTVTVTEVLCSFRSAAMLLIILR